MPRSTWSDSFDEILSQPAHYELGRMGGALELLGLLADEHQALWDLEDQARSSSASDETIATVKRLIDTHNGARHRLIDDIDAQVRAATPEPGPAVRVFSETIGELCDRLVVLHLKHRAADDLAGDTGLSAEKVEQCREMAKRLDTWRRCLHAVLRDTLEALGSGRAFLPPRSEFKMYNDPELNPVTRRERG